MFRTETKYVSVNHERIPGIFNSFRKKNPSQMSNIAQGSNEL